MAPTIQSGLQNERDRKARVGEKKPELVCRVKYCNTLPDIPFDPKFVTYPFESNRFVSYNATSLERNYKYELLTEHDLGVTIDLINPDTYKIDLLANLDVPDEKLLEEDLITPQDSKRSRHHARSVSWLRRTEYISTEYNRFIPSAEKHETKVGHNIKKFFKEEDLYKDRDSQISAIDKTFEDAKTIVPKHYSKPNVTPVEILPVFPDEELWRYPCAQVIFDADPAPKGRTLPAQMEEMSQAMIRGMMDESGDQFVAYFLPSDETLKKRKRDAEEGMDYIPEDEYDYKMAREYNWNVKNKASKGYEENYFFVFRESGVYYNELETKVRLSKRRVKGQGVQASNSRLIVRHRPLTDLEKNAQETRLAQLENPVEEEEEEEEEMQVDNIEAEPTNGPIENTASHSEKEESGSEKGSSDHEGEPEKNETRSEKSSSESEAEEKSEKSASESDSEAEADQKKDEEEIFGSSNSSESGSESD